MATTKRRTPAERVVALLTKNKALTEKEVIEQIKGADRKMVREARRALGIDRPSALVAVRGWLERSPAQPAGKVITACLNTYGIRLGPPDVSRLRPVKAKTGGRPLRLGNGITEPKFKTADDAYEAVKRLEARVKKLEGGKR